VTKVYKNNLEEICALMDADQERWRKEEESIIRAAGWVVISSEMFSNSGVDTAYAVHKSTGQIVEVRLDKNDDATNIEREVLDALTTRVSTLQERYEEQMKDMGLL
jgi:hypothetical protein